LAKFVSVTATRLYLPWGGWKPTHLTSGNIRIKPLAKYHEEAIKTDVRRENTNVRWVGFRPLLSLGHLGRRDINRKDPICAALSKVAKASKEGDAISLALSYQTSPM